VRQHANSQIRILLVVYEPAIGGTALEIASLRLGHSEPLARRSVVDSVLSKTKDATHGWDIGASLYEGVYEEEISMRRSRSA
jgi:hypothetical protein